ncbi:YciI family protein [Streptomyces sp. Ru62]|uniref:YciI family protein n=1 Tax=Streptomyces sp. Ru62 TaxID=2080745 RepID=UPI0015E292D3|nr:YciI family protein [Streptomyces sp. Ru62]
MRSEQNRPYPDDTHELLYLVMSRLVGDDPSTLLPKIKEHLAFGADLESRGITFEGGPLMTPDGENSGTGLYILRAASLAEAEQIASQDPLHAAGLRTPTVSPWYRRRRPAEST